MKATEYQAGDRVYYTGDMANLPSEGIIVKRNEPDRFAPINYDIRFDKDGEIHRGVYYLSFESSPGRRFWLLSEWEADLYASIKRMQAMKTV